MLAGKLAHPVWGDRLLVGCLRGGHGLGLAVEHPTAAGEHHPLHAAFRRAAQQVHQPQQVDVGIVGWIGDRMANVDLRRLETEQVEASRGHQLPGLGRTYVTLYKRGSGRDVGALAAREVVENGDIPAIVEQGLGDMGTDEPGTAGDQGALRHAGISTGSNTARSPGARNARNIDG